METQNSQRRYRYIFFVRIVLGLVISLGLLSECLALIMLIGAMINFSPSYLLLALGGAILMGFFLLNSFPLWNSYIEFSSEGILCKNGMYRIYSPWENVMTIKRMNIVRYNTVFVLCEPARTTNSFSDDVNNKQPIIERLSFLMPMSDIRQKASTIPFLIFVSQSEWKSGELRAYFQHYAPHLLEKGINTQHSVWHQ